MARKRDERVSWDEAEWEYSALQAELQIFGANPLEGLSAIAERHPDFYPVLLELGLRQLYLGDPGNGEANVAKGLEAFWRHPAPGTKREQLESATNVVLNLHDAFRYDLVAPFLAETLERYPREAGLWSERAHAQAMLGRFEEARQAAAKAVALEPKRAAHRVNQACVALDAGCLDEAAAALDGLGPLRGAEVREGWAENHATLAWLRRRGGTRLQYLLRPLDEEPGAEVAGRNSQRLEAMGIERLRQGRIRPFSARRRTLVAFFGVVGQGVFEDRVPLYEDLHELDELEEILNTFVIRHTDGGEALAEVAEALLDFYGFLSGHGLLAEPGVERFGKALAKALPRVAGRARRYRAARAKDPLLDRAKLIDRIFGDKHRVFA